MIKATYYFFITSLFSVSMMMSATAFCQAAKNDGGEVVVDVKADTKLAIFEKAASFSVSLKNTFDSEQDGKLSYQVTQEDGEKVKELSQAIKIGRRGSETYHFDLPEMKTGFYKISFMVNTSDYDDTLKKAFGISPAEIQPTTQKPTDFDAFWSATKAELAKVQPQFKMTEQPNKEKKGYKTYLVEMKSLDNLTIRGWLTMPTRKGKFAVYLDLPGYQNTMDTLFADQDFAVLSLNVRGHGNSRDVISTKREDYVTLHLEDKNRYVYRGAIMDCIRAVDFIESRPELNGKSIVVTSGSQGAFLALALVSLDDRVKLCSAQNPIFCDFSTLFKKVEWPTKDMKHYCDAVMHGNMEKLMSNLAYFDCKNFAVNVHCNVLMGMGLLDHLASPDNVYEVYNLIPSKNKKIFIYPNLTHEVGKNYQPYEYKWIKDEFALYN